MYVLQIVCVTSGTWGYWPIVTDRISVGGNALAPVRPSVRLFPLYLRNRLTVDLELLHVSIGHDHGSQGIEGQGDHESG